jgi:cytochrome c556
MFSSSRWLCAVGVGAALLVGVASDVSAQGRGGGTPLTPVTYRQQLMQQNAQSTGAMTALRGGLVGSADNLLGRAIILQQLAQALPAAFAQNDVTPPTRALTAIWSNPAGFATAVEAFQSAADALVEAARGGNMAAIEEAQGALQPTCGACHTEFRGPAQ